MPTYKNLLDILNSQTAQQAKEYSRDFDSPAGMPSVVQQVNEVEQRQEQPTFRSLSPRDQGYYQGMYDSTFGYTTNEIERPSNLKYSDRDDVYTSYNDALHTEDRRALQQSGAEQLVNGITKGVVIAGTTFVDGILGTAAGIANLAYQAANGDIERPTDALYAFVNNPVSQQLQKVNDWAEKVMPNYYSEEQRESPWYAPVNLFSANFVGDKFLKNTGFMLGAAYSGRVNAGLMSKAIAKKELRNAFKGVVVNSAGQELNTAAEIYKAYKTGDAFMNGVKLTKDLASQAKQIRNQEWGLKLLGAMTAASGEARIEAITNTEDYEKRMSAMIDDDYEAARSRVRDEIISRNTTDYPTYTLVFNPETGQAEPVLTELGQNLANEMLGDIEQRYQDAKIKLQKDKAVMANQIFGLNMFILTATDLFTFGRFISGGYNTQRGAKEFTNPAVKGVREKSNKERNKAIAKAVAVPFVEGPYEEMMQSSAATGAGYNASAKMNQFYGYKIDKDAETDAVNVANAILEGIRDTYGDVDRWEEGLIGAMSSIVGLPGFVEARDANGKIEYEEYKDKNGRTRYKPKQKFRWQGEFWESIRDARQASKDSERLTNELNKVIQRDDFTQKWQSYIRHKAFDNIKEAALDSGDPFAYKNAESSQMISDIMAFDDAGRIQDLYEIIDENSNITSQDIETIKSSTKDPQTNKSPYDDMSDEEIIAKIKERTEDFKSKLDKYLEIKDNIRQVYGTNMDKDFQEAMTWAYMSIDDAEGRIKNISRELIPKLNDIFHVFSALTSEQIGFDVNNLNDLYRFMITGNARDKFIKAINSKSARNLSQDKLFGIIEEMLKQKDESLDVLESQKKKQTLSDSEIDKVNRWHDNALASYMRAKELLDLIDKDPSLHAISDLEMHDVNVKMSDLANLIAYKTEFLNMLAKLSADPGAFNKDIVQFRLDRQKEHDKSEAQKIYDSINDEVSQKDFNQILLTTVKNKEQQDLLYDMLKNSSNQNIKNMYKEFDRLYNAIGKLSELSILNANDPDYEAKGAFNSIFMQMVDSDTPATLTDLLRYLDETAKELDVPVAYQYAEFLKNKISTETERRKAAEDAVKKVDKKKYITPESEAKEKEIDDKGYKGTPLFDDKGENTYDKEPIETGDAAGGEVDPNENMRIVEETISDLPIDALRDIVDNNNIPTSISGKASLEEIKILADFYLGKKSGEDGGSPSEIEELKARRKITEQDEKGSSPRDEMNSKDGKKIYNNVDGAILKGLDVTGFNTLALKESNGVIRLYNHPIASIFRDNFNTYEFLDSGALAEIEKYYISKGQTTPIKFVFANKNEGRRYANLHFEEEKNGRKFDRYNILLATEITDDVRNALNDAQKNQLREHTIDGKKYQIIGILGRLNDDIADFEAYRQIYELGIQSIDDQRSEKPDQDLFVANYRGEEITSSINKIYPGRRPKSQASVSLKSIMDTAFGGDVYLGVAVRSKQDGTIDIFSNLPEYIKPRKPSDIGIEVVPGMIFTFVPTPDGSYSYIPTLAKRSDEIDYNGDNDFINTLRNEVGVLLDPKASRLEKLQAKQFIMRAFNLGKTKFYFRTDELDAFRFNGQKITSWKEFVPALQGISAKINVDRNYVLRDEHNKYMESLIDADVLTVNYSSLRSYNSSFTINPLKSDGSTREVKRKRVTQVRQKYTVPTQYDVYDFKIGDDVHQFSFTSDGVIDLTDGSRVTDNRLITTIQVLHFDKTSQNTGVPIKVYQSASYTLYEVEPSADGTVERMFFSKRDSGVVRNISAEIANRIKNDIDRENSIEQAKKDEKERYGLKIFGEDEARVPVKAPELSPDALKPSGPSVDPTVREDASEQPKKPIKRKNKPRVATRQVDATMPILDEPTDNDVALAKRIREEKWNPKAIEQYFTNHGVSIRVAGLMPTPTAQLINRAIEENPELSIDKMLAEINCGTHGK